MIPPALMTSAATFVPSALVLTNRLSCLSRCERRRAYHVIPSVRWVSPSMSGVNGGIDYEIDLSKLPPLLAARVTYIQQGPDSPTELIAAAEQIASSTPEHPQLIPVLVDMLGFNNPVAANIAVDALSRAGSTAVPSLLTGVAAFNYAVNAYALRALGRIGCASVADVCLACAIKGPIPNVRRAACRALGSLRFGEVEDAESAYRNLITLADGELDWGVRYAAIVALEHFEAEQLVPLDILADGLRVVHAAADGRSHVSAFAVVKEAENETATAGSGDPTVAARASVAFDIMAQRLQSVDVSVESSVLSS